MATETEVQQELNIGVVAGMIWQYLDLNGPVTLSKLAKDVDAPRDLVMQGIGWLAREDKLRFEETPRSRIIRLA